MAALHDASVQNTDAFTPHGAQAGLAQARHARAREDFERRMGRLSRISLACTAMALTVLVSATVAVHADDRGDDAGDDQGDTTNSVIVLDAWARATARAGANAAVYATIVNDTDSEIVLVGGDSDVAAMTMIHETVMDGDVMRMRHLEDGLAIAPGEEIDLAPGGLHIMLMDVSAPLAVGDTFTVDLAFENTDPMSVDVIVMPAGATGPELQTH